jgi:hypothetical protein
MGMWLTELRRNLPSDIILHVVGTKADIVAREPARREVPFERCIAYVAENLAPGQGGTPPPTATPMVGIPGYFGEGSSSGVGGGGYGGSGAGGAGGLLGGAAGPGVHNSSNTEPRSPSSKRSSGFWGQEVGWDACHEISAESGEGVEEVFRVVTRKLVEQNRKIQAALLAAMASPGASTDGISAGLSGTMGAGGGGGGGFGGNLGPGGDYFDSANPRGSFRVGRDRRSWMFSPAIPIDQLPGGEGDPRTEDPRMKGRKRCC